MINSSNCSFNISGMTHQFQYVPYNEHIYTYKEVIGQFSSQFLFKVELLAISFLAVMVFLQWYDIKKEKEINNRIKWLEHISNCNVDPIFDTYSTQDNKERYLHFISDVFFIPSLAFILLIISYETGWL